MLLQLSIKNFIIIRDLELNFDTGFISFTGETGAGKSIIIDAISLLCGTPSKTSLIMQNETQSIVEGTFNISKLHNLFKEWAEEDDPHITVTRVITKSNRNIAKINGQSIPIKQLQELMKSVINIIGQHETTKFLDSKSQLALLDQLLPTASQTIIQNYHHELQKLKEIERKIKEITIMSTDDSLTEFLKFQLEDIQKQKFKLNEETELRDKKQLYKSHQKKYKDLIAIQNELSTAQHALTHAEQIVTDQLPHYRESYQAALILTQEISHEISQNLTKPICEIDINDIESRLDTIFKYKTKYKAITLNELVEKVSTLKTQIAITENRDAQLKEYNTQRTTQTAIVIALAKQLHLERVKTAQVISQKISETLKSLNFETGSCRFVVEFDDTLLKETGCSKCSILIKPSAGQKEGPITEIASGGELSRIMLAIRSSVMDADNPSSMIFDEIDAGIGGLTALKIGEKIQSLSQKAQVICVTHLPQIAKFANIHFSVAKNTQKNPTEITAKRLKHNEVKAELERMIGGKEMIKEMLTDLK